MWEMLGSQPSILEASISANGLKPIIYTSEDFLRFEFKGIQLCALPLIQGLNSWESILAFFEENKLDVRGINFSRIDSVVFNLKTDPPLRDYEVKLTLVGYNLQRFVGGMTGLKYSS